ncbi:ArgS-related anticodon-binding protein NrtL [Streptomyces sp. NPDC096012]|uniref:ArgS-related anticodon-binding protein NrtL n=1 Tax=Streptomyces sp. NPDC096012 TaxID=3155684 RepID=UPI00336ABC62
MTPVELSRTVLRAVRRAVDDGELSVSVPERVVVTEPGPGGCGDYATNIALQLARPAGMPPPRVAEILWARLAGADGIRDVVVTGPGFLNITLDAQVDLLTGLVREIRERGTAYGHGDALAGQVLALRVPYEVRAEVVADAVVRIVATQGGRATVEHGEPVNLRPVPAPEDPAPLGPDAAQWALLHPAPHDRPRITADHLVQRESNPLFRVRYAHARIRSLSRNAARLGFTAEPGPVDLGCTRTTSRPGLPAEPSPVTLGRTHSESGSGPIAEPGPVDLGCTRTTSRPGLPAEPSPVTLGRTHSESGPGLPAEPAPVTLGRPPAQPSAGAREAGGAHPTRPHGGVPIGSGAPRNPAAPPAPSAPSAPGAPPSVRPLITPLTDHPRILAAAATHRAPDRVARHLVSLADAVLPLLASVLPRGEEKPSAAHRARLALAEAVGTVLAGGLSLLGIDAPEHL